MVLIDDGVDACQVPAPRRIGLRGRLSRLISGGWGQTPASVRHCRAVDATDQPAGFLLVLSTAFPEPITPPLSAIQLQPLERIHGSPVLAEAMAKAEAAHATQDQQQRHLVGRRRRIARLAQHGHQR